MMPSQDGHGNARHYQSTSDLLTRSLAKKIIIKTIPMLDRVHRAQRYRYVTRLEGVLHEVLKLSIEAPRAKTITKCAALVDTIDLLHDVLEIGAASKIIKGAFLASIMQPKTEEHPGGELWQLAAISKSMLNKIKKK